LNANREIISVVLIDKFSIIKCIVCLFGSFRLE